MNKKGLICLVLAIFLLGSMEVAVKEAGGAFNPIQLNFLRFSLGTLVLLPLAISRLRQTKYKLTRKDILGFAAMGLVGIVISLSFYTISLSYITAYQVAVYFSGNTFFAILFAGIFLGETIRPTSKIAIAIAFIGMLIILNPFHFEGNLLGVVFALISAVTFAIYGVFCKYLTMGKPTAGNVMTCFSMLFGSLELLVLILILKIPAVEAVVAKAGLPELTNITFFGGLNSHTFLLFLYIGIGVTGLGFATYFIAMETLSVAMASLVFLVKPVLAPIMAYFVLGETMSLKNCIGVAVIAVGSAWLFRNNLQHIKNIKARQQALALEAEEAKLKNPGAVIEEEKVTPVNTEK